MIRTSLRFLAAGSAALALLIVSAPLAVAQSSGGVVVRDMRRLGGSTAFYRPALTNVAALKRMSDDARAVTGLRSVLEQAGLASVTDEVMAAFSGASTAYAGVACADATPAPGTIVECDVQPGQTIQWMAYRPKGGAPALLRDMRWAGRRPFSAFLFRVTEGDRTYTFIVPKECGNLSLLRTEDRPPAPVPPPVAAPPPPPPPPAPVVVPPPPPPPEPVSQQTGFQPSPAPVVVSSPMFFADGLFGKERRVRSIDDDALLESDEEFAQCSPLAGVKLGIAKRFANNWEVAGAVGVALNLVSDDDKVREHALFVDVEANKYIGNAFVGVGLSLWDFTRSETVTPAALVHVGLPLAPNARIPIYFLVEGRLFFDGADDIDNNYMFWGGLRLRF